jgi:hypothetical protein
MGKKVQTLVTMVDDLTGEEIPDGQAEEVFIGWNNIQYRLDLSKSNAAKLEKLITPYIEVAARASGSRRGRPRGSGSSGTRAPSGSGRSKEALQDVRDWAAKNGHEVSPRGRIKGDVLEAYDAAHAASPQFSGP